jgi:DNA invertase Pin-like site-specific DNA recombinase
MPRYVIYARKSSESEDRQVLSIDSQVKELKDHAAGRGIDVAHVYSESRSARSPGRPVFAAMLHDVARRNADGILCWKLDRLARNPVDGGALIWAVEEGKVKEIATPGRTFANDGNDKFWMQLEFGMAKKYIDDLSENVRRGNRAKLALGWLPGRPPIGYMNDPVSRTIIKDTERFALVRRLWDALLSGTRPLGILRQANVEWGFRTRLSKRYGSTPLSRTGLYLIFANHFYYGLIRRNGESFEGAHEPMVTKSEFDTAQRILGRPERPKAKRHEWVYTGFIRCGECDGSITAEQKRNRYGRRYIYYHCSKRKRGVRCHQRVIQVGALEEQFHALLCHVHLYDKASRWALDRFGRLKHEAAEEAETAKRSLEGILAKTDAKLGRLTDLRVSGLIGDEEFGPKRQELVTERLRLREQLGRVGETQPQWFESSERAFLLANYAGQRFHNGTAAEKREILLAIGSNFSLRDGILRTQLQKPFEVIAEKKRYPAWWAQLDEVRTFFTHEPHSIQWPAFCKDPKVLQRLKRDLFRRVARASRSDSTRRARRTRSSVKVV